MTSKDTCGYVYILQSPNCGCIKIGGTDFPPLKRIREMVNTINSDLGLKTEEWIQVGEDRFRLRRLLNSYRNGIEKISGEELIYSVAELLESVDPDYLREPGLFDPRRKTGASAEELFSPVP